MISVDLLFIAFLFQAAFVQSFEGCLKAGGGSLMTSSSASCPEPERELQRHLVACRVKCLTLEEKAGLSRIQH